MRSLMKTVVVLGAVAVWPVAAAAAQENTDQARKDPPPAAVAGKRGDQEEAEAKKSERAELEQRFRESLAGVVLKGTWRMTTDLKGKSPLSEPKEEKYSITNVEKIDGDKWVINARIQFADKDVTIPVPVRVVWAEDTPIITINELTMPMLGTYSARVMVYRGYYCGTWFGPNYGGVMSGEITRPTEQESTDKSP